MADKKITQLIETSTIGDNDWLTSVQDSKNKKIKGINSDNSFNYRWLYQEAPSGFLKIIDEIASVTFDDENHKLIITPVNSTFKVYSGGKKIVKTGTQEVVIALTEGIHWIYYDDNGNLLDYPNPSFDWQVLILERYAIVAFVYWDNTTEESIYFTAKNELHGLNFPGTVHVHAHFTQGTKYLNGCTLTDLQLEQSGALDSHAQFGVTAGQIQDEDLTLSLLAVLSTAGLPIYYLNGASANLRRDFNAGFSVLTTGTGRLAYNQYTSGAWQLTEVTNNKYVNYFVFAYNDGSYGYCSFIGQTEYNSKRDAEEAATTEAYTIIKGDFPFLESIACAVVTFQTSDSYGNAVKARVIAALDVSKSNLNTVLSLNLNHNTLANLQLAAVSGVTWGHVDADLYALFVNPDQENIYYFGYHGNNTYTGKNPERAVQDPQIAINLALALTPSPDKRFTIACADSHTYPSPANLYGWMNLIAPSAGFSNGAMSIADNCQVILDRFANDGIVGRQLLKTGSTISYCKIKYIAAIVDVNGGIVHLKTTNHIAPTTSDEYLLVEAGTTLYYTADKYKGKITVESGGTAYLYIKDSSEITENFAAGSIVYTKYEDWSQEHIYYFAKHGNNSKSGLTLEEAVADPNTAETLAYTQTPSATNRFTLVCLDAGIYTPPANLHSWISIFAPNATFKGGAISVDNNCYFRLYHFDNEGEISRKILKTGTGTSFFQIDLLDGAIDVYDPDGSGTLYLKTIRHIAPTTSDEYLLVEAGTTLYYTADKYKGKITVGNEATAYIHIKNSNEVTENFAGGITGAIVYINYLDRKNVRKNVTTGTFDVEPWHEGRRFINKAATTDVDFNLPPANANMFNRKAYGFYVSDSETYYENIICDGTDKIRVVDVLDSKLRSKTNGCGVVLYCANTGEWTVQSIIGTWELISKT